MPSGELLLCNFPGFDPSEAALVFSAVFLKDLVAPAALRPLANRSGAPAELAGRAAGAAAILRCDPPGDGEVPPTVSAPPDRNLPSDTFPESEVDQVPDRIGV